MAPEIASLLCGIAILGLYWLDRDEDSRSSGALWIAVVWLSLSGSRSVAQWLGAGQPMAPAIEGDPVDRLVYLSLVVIGLVALIVRRQFLRFLRANGAITGFFVYCALSILWSDYPDVAFKRWTKAFGDFIMVLIVLSDPNRIGAIRKLLARTGFILLPLSILLIKYYPNLGRGYSRWEGTAFYNGVATTKNALGMICLLFGVAALWRCLEILARPIRRARNRHLVAQGTLFIMAAWLCVVSNSMTSLWCLVLGSVLVGATTLRKPTTGLAVVHVLVAAVILLPFSTLFLGIGSSLAHGATGRNVSTLTDRTDVWRACLSLVENRTLGTGFESFWLGSRIEILARVFWWRPNEAHNGYLEVFLNLGWLGVALLLVVIATGYRNVIAALKLNLPEGSVILALFAVGIVYNFTEAAFFKMMTPSWILFLLAITKVPGLDVPRLEFHRNGSDPWGWTS
jgi:exopolysaccharide production protein ExoQ